MRHQAFQAELQANKARLQQLHHAAEQMAEEKPEFHELIDPQVLDLADQWEQLERTTEEKGQRLFDANRQQLYVQSIGEVQDWAQQLEQQIGGAGPEVAQPQDLTTVELAMQRQQQMEQEMARKVQHLESLQEMEPKLEEMQASGGREMVVVKGEGWGSGRKCQCPSTKLFLPPSFSPSKSSRSRPTALP
jgi:spectrin beta